MSITETARTRYTTKVFDPSRKIPQDTLEDLLTLLRYTPSSVNSQPWHFIIAGTEEGKARIARATRDGNSYNADKILNASHVVVLCVHTDFTGEHLAALLHQEEQDGRLLTPEASATQNTTRCKYVNLHRDERRDLRHWMEKQVYIALGTLLLGAAELQVDACPIEGFDARILDAELGLADRGLASQVLVALGYRSEDDFNARLPKSRLPAETTFTFI